MRVVVHPADTGGCGHYRMIYPAEALAAAGYPVTVDQDRLYTAQFQPSVFGDRLIGVMGDIDADVVVFQRPLRRERVELIRALQARGVAVVVEVDDDFHAVHRRNPAWASTNPLNDPDMNRDWLMRACQIADLVTVTTPALADRYGTHGRVAIIPNYVPAAYLTTEPGAYTAEYLTDIPGTVLGWTGSIATHPADLEVTGGAIPAVLDATDARFHVIGTGKGVAGALNLDVQPTSTGWLPIVAYPEAIRQLDVGIVPLAAHSFNEAKSWLKGLEFAALGVPFVASPTGPYRALHTNGFGWLADSPAEWVRLTARLLADPILLADEATRHRELAADFTVEANAWRWWAAWETALVNRHERVAA